MAHIEIDDDTLWDAVEHHVEHFVENKLCDLDTGDTSKLAEYCEAIEVVVADDLRDIEKRLWEAENAALIARREVDVLLRERENVWYRRLRRLCDRMIRRVHWHMPRR